MKSKFYILFFISLLFSPVLADELPIPSYSNALIISLEHKLFQNDYSEEIDYIKSNFNFGLYAWLCFSHTSLSTPMKWQVDLNNAAQEIQRFKDDVNLLLSRAREKNVRIHLVLVSGLARDLVLYRDAKVEDVRNCEWYNDNNIATSDQLTKANYLDDYVFGTLSRYARKQQAHLEAKAKAVLAFLKQQINQYPDHLFVLSGWGEVELNFNRLNDGSLQNYFCDYSPFAVLEFRDWLRHTGMYDDANGKYKGEGYSGGGTKYQGADGLARFNQDFGTNFTAWDLKYFNWSLSDDYDSNPQDSVNNDPRRIALSSYSHGNLMPSSGSSFIAGGFDPPRKMEIYGINKFWDLWNLFREKMVHNFVKDAAKWASEAGIPSDRWYSHQIPADYLFGTGPEDTYKNQRYYSSASPLWTADISPYGSLGSTNYDIKFPGWFARTSTRLIPAISQMSSNWAFLEYDAETYPPGYDVTQSSPEFILEQYLYLYDHGVHFINFLKWLGLIENRIKGMNKEIALKNLVQKVRDKARRSVDTVFDPPKVFDFQAQFLPDKGTAKLEISGKIWNGHPWEWKQWGDFSYFEIYRANEPNFTPSSGNRLATTTNYSYEDSSIAYGNAYFYKMRAVNSKSVGGPFSDEIMLLASSTPTAVLHVNKKSLSFSIGQASQLNSSETVLISNIGSSGTTLQWQASTSQTWITLNPASGTGNGSLVVSVTTSGLTPGTYTGEVRITANAPNSPQTIAVTFYYAHSGIDQPPFGSFDTPAATSAVSGNVPVTGWALDDILVIKVEIKRAPVSGESAQALAEDGLIYIGDATFVKGARPDIEQAYPNYPNKDKAGWGYMMLTNFLPNQGNGTFTIYTFAHDSGGHKVELGRKTIVCDNANRTKPFGTIDTPKQGETIGGTSYVNFGWALTPPPKIIPTDGSTIDVWVDGVKLGHPVYNQYRSDIAILFPGYLNSNGAVGYYYLNTTLYANGVHTIAWSVTDDAGQTDGIGSRYFEIQNGTSAQSSTIFPPGWRYVEDPGGRIKIELEGGNDLEVEELGRIELRFRGENGLEFIGWGMDKTKELPLGSTLDRQKGIFYWHPGPGFLGKHVLHFALTDGAYTSNPVQVVIHIVPKKWL